VALGRVLVPLDREPGLVARELVAHTAPAAAGEEGDDRRAAHLYSSLKDQPRALHASATCTACAGSVHSTTTRRRLPATSLRISPSSSSCGASGLRGSPGQGAGGAAAAACPPAGGGAPPPDSAAPSAS